MFLFVLAVGHRSEDGGVQTGLSRRGVHVMFPSGRQLTVSTVSCGFVVGNVVDDGLRCPRLLTLDCAVSSHKLRAGHFKVRVSNPRIAACLDLKVPFQSSKLPGSGPIFLFSQIGLLTTDHRTPCGGVCRPWPQEPANGSGFHGAG